jgi:hypothetical protein
MEIARKELGDLSERLPATTYKRGGMGESLIWRAKVTNGMFTQVRLSPNPPQSIVSFG